MFVYLNYKRSEIETISHNTDPVILMINLCIESRITWFRLLARAVVVNIEDIGHEKYQLL